MRKAFTLFAAFFITVASSAQSYKDVIASNPKMAASNYLAYPTPTQKITPSPSGYEPYYLSHYGRHGSRYLINPKQYSRPIAILAHADSLGILSENGKYALKAARMMSAEAYNRYGELTGLGAEQHRQIASRMIERFPEVFSGETNIEARSTVVIRCILSMENELQELMRRNNKLNIFCDASEHDMYYMNNYKDHFVDSLRRLPSVKQAYDDWTKRHVDNSRLISSLFTDKDYADKLKNGNQLAEDLFQLATIAQNSEIGKEIDLYHLFTTDELYHLWEQTNTWWYLNYGASAVSGGRMPWLEKPLVKDIVEKADSCLKLNHPGATLRFGHESVVMPLVCLLDINGYGLQTANVDSLEQYGWINTKIYPMGCNVQFVFYRPTVESGKKITDDDILVKVLLNEEEATLPIQPAKGLRFKENVKANPYYRWSDARKYFLSVVDKK